ncbi:MAG: hypothetical protein JW821_11650, partial [Deltaproteobacteria bacterium]|nr:hypothetical protein [Deltaproteobacteria bacterium]
MTRRTIAILLFWTLALLWPPGARGAEVRVEVIHSRDGYRAGESYPVLFRLRIPRSLFLHGSETTGEGLIPTRLSFGTHPGLQIREIRFPSPEIRRFSYSPDPLEVFSGDVLVRAALVLTPDLPPGDHVLEGDVSYQACSSDACFPPETVSLSVPVRVIPPGGQSADLNRDLFASAIPPPEGETSPHGPWLGAGFLLTLFGIFLGGLALNLTPCIYPLIPITVSYFSARSGRLRGHSLIHSVLYVCGLAVTN